MNKKDISIKDIDFKNLKNKKEIGICILIAVYIIVVIFVGKVLLDQRSDAKSELETKDARYNSLRSADSESEIKAEIEKLSLEKSQFDEKIQSITSSEFSEIIREFKNNAPVKWNTEEISIRNAKGFEEYDIYVVNIKTFTGSFKQVEEFLEYIDNYKKIIRVDTISFEKKEIIGNYSGSAKLSFYFKKVTE